MPQSEKPLGGYAALMVLYGAAVAGFSAWLRGSGRELPDRIGAGDLALLTVASHKASRVIAKDRVASAVRAPFTEHEEDAGHGKVDERARGRGTRKAIGQLLVCPYCLGVWVASGFAAGLVVAPRPTRWCMSVLAAVFGADVLQLAYKRAEDAV